MIGHLAHRSAPALGSTAELLVTDPADMDDCWRIVLAEVAAIDQAASRFRSDSELSRLNQADGRAVLVSDLLAEAIRASLRAASLTDGDVDPTCGQALARLGYDRDFAAVAADGVPLRCRLEPVPGWRTVTITGNTVRVPPGVVLDLGATAKALAADRAATAAAAAARGGVLVSLGGDIAVDGPAPADGWTVRVAEDHTAPPGADAEVVTVHEGGLATSSTTARSWRRGNRSLHHIVNPATGQSASPCWRTVSVAAGSCVDANIASTAAIVRGPAAAAWLAAAGLPARLVAATGVVLRVAGWPAPRPSAHGRRQCR